MPPGHDTGSRRRAVEVRSVESVETQSAPCQFVEVRRFEFGMAVVTRVAPALIVGHNEHNIRAVDIRAVDIRADDRRISRLGDLGKQYRNSQTGLQQKR